MLNKIDKAGRETWIELNTATTTTGDNYSLIIVQTAAMEQEVIADPDAMASDINATGHFTVYGIYFDHNSYAVKPEYEPALNAIAKMRGQTRPLMFMWLAIPTLPGSQHTTWTYPEKELKR